MFRRYSILTAVLIWLLFWTLMTLVAIGEAGRNGVTAVWQPILWEASSALVVTALLLVQRRFTARQDALVSSPWRWFLLQACWLPLYWVAFVPLVFGIRHGVYALLGLRYRHDPWHEVFVYEAIKVTVFLGLFMAITFGLLSYRALLNERLRSERSQALLRQAQLERLAQQMQPHFLFNALNTISSLMHSDVTRADTTLVQLSDVLRATLALGERTQASLADELRLARGYAGVMVERFEGRVSLYWRINDELLGVLLPAVSLQPLLENVFKHTVERQRAPTRITVSATRDGQQAVIRVEDDRGMLAMDAEPGISLANLRTRLAVLHGENAGLVLSQMGPSGVRAEMRVPCAF